MTYKVIYNLMPHDFNIFEINAVMKEATANKQTVGFSADDAARLVQFGREDSLVIAWEPQRIGTGLTQEWFDNNYAGVNMRPRRLKGLFCFDAWPTEYPYVTQPFGANADYYGQFGLPGHEGVDIQAPHLSRIFSVADGIVSDINIDLGIGHNYGKFIRIAHIGGYESTYAHLDRIHDGMYVGARVAAGDIIAYADNTGNSFGSHLHLTLKLKDGSETVYPHQIVDPMVYVEALLNGPS